MIFFSGALFIAAALLAVQHVQAGRGKALSTVLSGVVAVFVVLASVGTIVQVYRIGDSGAKATLERQAAVAGVVQRRRRRRLNGLSRAA